MSLAKNADAALWLHGRARSTSPGLIDGRRGSLQAGVGQHAFGQRRRPRRLLAGKVICAGHGNGIWVFGEDDRGYRAARNGDACRATTTRVRRAILDARPLPALGTKPMRPDLFAEFRATFIATSDRLAAETFAGAPARPREGQSAAGSRADLGPGGGSRARRWMAGWPRLRPRCVPTLRAPMPSGSPPSSSRRSKARVIRPASNAPAPSSPCPRMAGQTSRHAMLPSPHVANDGSAARRGWDRGDVPPASFSRAAAGTPPRAPRRCG